MKKFFVEPEIQKLKLNLHENIAVSGGCDLPDYAEKYKAGIFSADPELDPNLFKSMYDGYAAINDIAAANNLLQSSIFTKCLIGIEIYVQ